MAIRASSRRGDLPRVEAFAKGQWHRAWVGTHTLYQPSKDGETTGVGSGDAQLNSFFSHPDWTLDAGQATFKVSASDSVNTAMLAVCSDPGCHDYLQNERFHRPWEEAWRVNIAPGTYRLFMSLKFDRGDADYVWTFRVKKDRA